MEKGYKKLLIWQKADELAYQVYIATKIFPKDELYGLTSQLRRATTSIPINIAEGSGRQNRNEFKQFINIALGSLAETEYILNFCFRLGYLQKSCYERIEKLRDETGAMLYCFYKNF